MCGRYTQCIDLKTLQERSRFAEAPWLDAKADPKDLAAARALP
jgi:hypothetical protein